MPGRRGGWGRRLALCLLLAVAWSVAGCSGTAAAPAQNPAGVFRPGTPDTLTVATAEVPIPGFWEGPAAAPNAGFEAGLARALADRFGLSKVKVVLVPFAQLVGGDLGGADIGLSQVTATGQRAQHLDFSMPYLPAAPSALVRTGRTVPDLNAARQLRWAVHQGTTLDIALSSLIKPTTPTIEAPDQAAAVAALEQGRADAVLLDLPVALALADRSDGALSVAAQLPTDDSLSVALPNGSPNLEAVDSAIRSFTSNGTIQDLAQRWLGAPFVNGTVDIPVLRISP